MGTLCEFYPPEPNLLGLNINRGQKICLRLRYPGDETQFLPLDQVVDTMLHELCHIVHGPHNQQFHALWDQLRDEHQALALKGYTGEGFLGRGDRLGGQRIPMHEARRRARAAAERRKTLTAGSGQKLGGRAVKHGEDVRSVIVNAIEQRNRINQGCASGTEKGRQIAIDVDATKPGFTTTQAGQDDPNEAAIMQAYIEMIQQEEREKHGGTYMPPSQNNPAGVRSAPTAPVSAGSLRAQQASIEKSMTRRDLHLTLPTDDKAAQVLEKTPKASDQKIFASGGRPDTWTCEICTLVNPIDFLQCGACETNRSQSLVEISQQRAVKSSKHMNPKRHNLPNPNHKALRSKTDLADTFAKAAEARMQQKPAAWRCHGCGTYVDQEWWSCNSCGSVRTSS